MSDPMAAARGSASTDADEYVTAAEEADSTPAKSRSLTSDAWHDLRRRPLFIIAITVIAFLVTMAVAPSLFTDADPGAKDLQRSRIGPNMPLLAVLFAIGGAGLVAASGISAAASRSRDGVGLSLVAPLAGIGGVVLIVSHFFAANVLYLVVGTLVLIAGLAAASTVGKRLLVGVSTVAGVAVIAVALVVGVLAVIDLTSVETAAPFGYDLQGQDLYARIVHGTKWTLLVGVFASVLTVLVGGAIGVVAGYFGGWIDAIMSRFAEVFFGLPFILGAIVVLSAFRSSGAVSATAIVATVVASIAMLSWPIAMRIARAAAISAKQQDYVRAARALGAGPGRIIFRHMLPNCLAPVLVYATIALGAFIGAEATLSFLGIGLRDPAVSWGVMIADSRNYIRASPLLLIFPASFLTLTVLVFVTIGDAVREALDPKLR